MPLFKFSFRPARRAAEKLLKALIDRVQTPAITEVVHVHPVRSILFQIDKMVQDRLGVDGLPVRRQSHQFILAGIDPKTKIVGKRRVQEPERVRKMDLRVDLHAVSLPGTKACRRPLSHAVDGEEGGAFKRRGVERGRGMGLMMFGKKYRTLVLERLLDHKADIKFLRDPKRDRLQKRSETSGSRPQMSAQDPVELKEGLVVKSNRVQVLRADLAFREAIGRGIRRGRIVVLLS